MEQGRAKDMATTGLDGILRHLRRAVRPPDGGGTDSRLLELFLRRRDEAAFESLILRHGPMVFGVCRRVLGNEQDAEDAFQATFLVLVRKAASVRKRGALGTWLYGVAYRTALEARRAMARRRAKERKVVPRVEAPAEGGDDLREVLDRELAALPDRYRDVVVLCDLEGKGRKEVAQELGCPEGTVASRLARARALLAKRLARYGLATAAVAAGVSREASSACVPASLVSSTVRAAAGPAAAAGVSANVSSLVERVVRAMLLLKLRAVTPALLVACVLAVGAAGWLYHHAAAAQPDAAGSAAAQPGGADRSEKEKLREELDLLRADLRKAMERAAALEGGLAAPGDGKDEVLYQGKPAAFWLKQLKDRDTGYRTNAVNALGHIAEVDRGVIPALVEASGDRVDQVRASAVFALSGLGEEAVPDLLAALKGSKGRARLGVMAALHAMGPRAKEAIPTLLGILKGGEPTERGCAAQALAEIDPGDKGLVPPLIELLRTGNAVDRYHAAAALGTLGPDAKEAVPDLIELLGQPTKDECFAAVDALGRIGPDAKPAIWALAKLLGQRKPVVVGPPVSVDVSHSGAYLSSPAAKAAEALGRIGPDARPVVPALVEVLLRPQPGEGDLPDVVRQAIKKIAPEEAAKVRRP
jgi:RNA polymerase sigma factor (sigma-70 family)